MSQDIYAEVLDAQNDGIPCKFCGSTSGHYNYCGLLNRSAGETQRAQEPRINANDTDMLHAMGVRWEGDKRG